MVVGGEGERSLEETPTWAVALVFVVLAGASLLIHYTIHLLGKAHLTPRETKFNFHKYIKKSLENDFKVVVGISPPLWLFAIFFLLFNTKGGWYSYIWLPIIPLMITMVVGTKLQVIITKMGLRIQDRYEIVKGVPVVEPDDGLFWFNSPRLFLFLINFILFQNAFEFAFFVWTWYTFGLGSCFLEHVEDIIIRLTMGILVQVICSYVTLPLYAIVTQMGSKMKPAIFNERIAMALQRWHRAAKKRIKDQNNINDSNLVTLISSRPGTPPNHSISPVHVLHGQGPYLSEMDIMSRGSINYAR
ncbi:unnamed protein product [Cuscuta epithymum]|uniref:MLO-like protein n=1 Tax=Cuscuta epithymum TaxID=186058 RepID=A0AAV0DSV0_9ASTE|nr:unnamed protein product [Cuscuta epithymum]